MRSPANCVILFAKYPAPGRVKTRLIGPLTPAEAAELHRRCLLATLRMLAQVPDIGIILAGDPDDSLAAFAKLAAEEALPIEYWPQGGGSLGRRLSGAVRRAIDAGCRRVLLLGCDSPTLAPDVLTRAVQTLRDYDMALGPALDGGYYLLGVRARRPDGEAVPFETLFDGIDWGTQRVADQTRDRARNVNATWVELPPHRDLDRWEDLLAAAADWQALPHLDVLRPYVDALLSKARAL